MFKSKDPYSFTKYCTLLNGSDTIGTISFEYQVTLYDDVQLADFTSVSKPKSRKYLVNCTQRINICNPTGIILGPSENLTSFDDYPVMVNTSISIDQSANEGVGFQLLDYSPQTINTQIQSSGSIGDSTGLTKGSSSSSTVGSSTSQTNSYGTSVTVGDISGVTATAEHSTTVSSDKSKTTGTDSSNSNSRDSSNASSMSIKDWGAYALVNPLSKGPTWTFGQEYPWDAIECRKTTGKANESNPKQVQILIPSSMTLRLYEVSNDLVSTLYPPSELSTYGINFVMKACWVVAVKDSTSPEITIGHVINYFTGTHKLITKTDNTSSVDVYMDLQPSVLQVNADESLDTTINLALMALDSLCLQNSASIIGFIPNKFIVKPVPATSSTAPIPFNVISTSNDLMILDSTVYPVPCDGGAGFTASQTYLTANFSTNCTSLEMTMYFKVIDVISDYTLFMKHWKSGVVGVVLKIVINGDTENLITNYIDTQEAEGGDVNLLSIELRNLDYASVYYYDYLQLGLNSIQITIQPIGTDIIDCGYQIRAISIEKS